MYREIEVGLSRKNSTMALRNLGNVNVILAPGAGMGMGTLIEAMMFSHYAFLAFAKYFPNTIHISSDTLFGMITTRPIAQEWREVKLTRHGGESRCLHVRFVGGWEGEFVEFRVLGEEKWGMSLLAGQATMLIPQVETLAWWIDFSQEVFVPNNRDWYPLPEFVNYSDNKRVVLVFGYPNENERLAEELLCRCEKEGRQVFWFNYGKEIAIRAEGVRRYTLDSFGVSD